MTDTVFSMNFAGFSNIIMNKSVKFVNDCLTTNSDETHIRLFILSHIITKVANSANINILYFLCSVVLVPIEKLECVKISDSAND